MPLDIFKNSLVQRSLNRGEVTSDTYHKIYDDRTINNLTGGGLFGSSEDEGYNKHTTGELEDPNYLENVLGENQEWTAIPLALTNLGKSLYNGTMSALETTGSLAIEGVDAISHGLANTVNYIARDNIAQGQSKEVYEKKKSDWRNTFSNTETDLENIYYSPKDDVLGKNYSEWFAEASNSMAQSVPAMVVGGGVGGLIGKGFSILALNTGRVLGQASLNSLGFLAKTASALKNPVLAQTIGNLSGGFATSRVIGEFNANDTFKDTYSTSMKNQIDSYKNTLKQQNPFASELELENAISDETLKSFELTAQEQATEASDTVKSLSWATGLLNVTSSMKAIGGSLTSKSGALLFGAARSKPFAQGYWKSFAKDLAIEIPQEGVEELFEQATQNYGKKKALDGKGSSGLMEGLSDSKLWNTLYDTAFSQEGLETFIVAGLSAGIMQGGTGVKDVTTGETVRHNKEHENWKVASSSLREYSEQLNTLKNAKNPQDVEKIKETLNKNTFLKGLAIDSLKSSIFSKFGELATEKGLHDLSDLYSKNDFANQVYNAFSLGLGDTVQDTLDTLGNSKHFDLLHSMTGTTPTKESESQMKHKISELKDITKASEKIFNEVAAKHQGTPQKLKSIYTKKVSNYIASKELLKQQIITQEKLQSVLSKIDTNSLLQNPEILSKHREITDTQGLGKAQEYLQEEFFKQSSESHVQEYLAQKGKEEGLQYSIDRINKDLQILETLNPTQDIKGTVHSTSDEAVKANTNIEKEEKVINNEASKNEVHSDEKLQSDLEDINKEINSVNNEIRTLEEEDDDTTINSEFLKELHLKKLAIENEIVKRVVKKQSQSEEVIQEPQEIENSGLQTEEVLSDEDRIKNDTIEARAILETTFGESLKGYNIEIICK